MAGEEQAPPVGLRVDSWLWRTRLFKTRGEAAAAVTGGRVQVNGTRVKSARPLRPGERVSLSRGALRVELTVLAIPDRRGPYPEAAACYREEFRSSPTPAPSNAPAGRPGKHDRRRLRQLRGR